MSEKQNEEFIRKYVRKAGPAYYFWRGFSAFLATILYRPKFKGKENVPESGGLIIASNHIHMADPAFVLMSTKRVVRYLAKRELLDSALGPIYRSASTIPVDRKNGAHNSMAAAEAALRQGEVIGIFPEGTRNRKMEVSLLPFRFGAVKMAQVTGAKILPIGYTSKGRPFLDPYRVVIGEAYTIEKDADLEKENEKLKEKIQALLDESLTL